MNDENSKENENFKFSHNDQTFNVIPLFSQTLNYTEQAKKGSSSEREALYEDNIISFFENKATELELNTSNYYKEYFEYNTNINELENNSKKLLKQKSDIFDVIKNALVESSNVLSGTNKTIFIMPLNPTNYFPIYNLGGVTAVTLSEDTMIIKLAPSFEKDQLKYTVAHEYGHSLEAESNGGDWSTILDLVVSEGKAETFARKVYPSVNTNWDSSLDDSQKNKILDILKKEGDSYDSNLYYTLEQGNSSKNIPEMSNYKIGSLILKDYLNKNETTSVNDWIELSPQKIIEQTSYDYINK